MIKNILFFAFFIIAVQVKAQFSPIAGRDSVSWTIKHEIWDAAELRSLYLSDTISVNKKQYYQVVLTNWSPSLRLVGYFREDSILGKAWFRGFKDTTEYLIMDLSLNKGDSIFIKMVYGKKYAHITNVEFEKGRKVLTTDYHIGGGFISENLKFIEGVGPNASILYKMDEESRQEINFQGGFLVCKAFHDNNLIYAWDTINYECGWMWDDLIVNIKDKVKIFPNPASKVLTISGEESLTTEIFDFKGSLLLRTREKKINIDWIANGIYAIKVFDGDTLIKTDKLVICNE
jgi:hypothetical protein